MSALSIGVCPDFAEEGWPSMDRVATGLLASLSSCDGLAVDAQVLRPPFRRRAMRLSTGRFGYSVDRACNRFLDYPRHLARLDGVHDVYHVIDHSYAHLARHLPAGRTVVTCHDLDAFRSIFDQSEDRRTAAFRAATRYILGGLRRAAAIACDTAAVAEELRRRRLVIPERVFVVHLGVGEAFSPHDDHEADRRLSELLPIPRNVPVVLHVGSTIPRKRIDLLLQMFARLDGFDVAPHLVRVGSAFSPEQLMLLRQLDLERRVTVLPSLDDRLLAAAYRRAAVLVLPSDREGFGLPVVEALRSGSTVVATDLSVLHEVGGHVTRYCPAGDADAWARTVANELRQTTPPAERAARVQWAEAFTWRRYAEQMLRIYRAVAERQSETLCVQAPA